MCIDSKHRVGLHSTFPHKKFETYLIWITETPREETPSIMINIRMNTVPHDSKKLSPKISVIGVGGAGGNAVNNMISSNLSGVDFVVCNTDSQALMGSLAEHKVQLGTVVTEGLGAGAKPEIGRAAAEESLDDVMQYLQDANMAFITAGMGGGTGTGAAAVIAKACRERGILTVGVVTKPFHFEGTRRMRMAEDGLAELQSYVDTLIVIPNQNLFRVVNDKTTFADGFKMADSVLQSAVRGVTDLIVKNGHVNLDFADIRSVMQEMGKAVMGTGEATGDNRAIEAAEKAISNPLLDDVSMKGARGVIVNITGGYDMTLFEVDEASNRVRDEVDPDANIIFGFTFDESMEGTIRVSIIATGIDAAVADKKTSSTSGRALMSGLTTNMASQRAPRMEQQVRAVEQPRPIEVQRPMNVSPARAAFPKSFTMAPVSQPAVQPVVNTAPQQSQQDAGYARATRMGDAFIPPQAVEVRGNNGYAAQMAQHPHQQTATQYAAEPQQEMYQEPVVTQQAKKKSPSLFERITSGYRRVEASIESFSTENDDFNKGAEAQSPSYNRPQARMAPSVSTQAQAHAQPAQGRLNIDMPSQPKAEEDELDIPAFLRRQTS
jgi:cell division protein FtsZ